LVAFVETPLQALNLLEYSQRFALEVDLVVMGCVSELEPTALTQIEGVLLLVGPQRIVYSECRLRAKRPNHARRALASDLAVLRAHLPVGPTEFVVGEYRSDFSWALIHRLKGQARSVTVVDDGTAMLRIDRRGSAPRSREQWRRKAKSLMFLAVGIHTAPLASLTFFTTYALDENVADGDTIIRNDYRTLSAELRKLPPDEDYVYVIGGDVCGPPWPWEGGEVDQVEIELALDLARFAAECTGKEVVYIAHRRELAEKLDALRKEFTVVTPNVPFEIYPRMLGKRPQTIVGYCSSALVTAAELLGDSVEIISLQIPRDRIADSWLPFIDRVYQYYRTELPTAIRIIDLPPPSPNRID
jgi:hypothetical protein